VEDALFKLPKNHFASSSIFATIFTLPPGEKGVEGTDDKPFVLHGISEVDFKSLLKVMYPMPFKDVQLTLQEWISVLKLSTMWEFIDIRNGAIDELSKQITEMGDVEKVECGRNFEVKEWVSEGYVGLLKRTGTKQTGTITDEEAERLGWKTVAKLLRLREQLSLTCQTCNGTGHENHHFGIQVACRPCSSSGQVTAGFTPHRQQTYTEAVQKEFQTDA